MIKRSPIKRSEDANRLSCAEIPDFCPINPRPIAVAFPPRDTIGTCIKIASDGLAAVGLACQADK